MSYWVLFLIIGVAALAGGMIIPTIIEAHTGEDYYPVAAFCIGVIEVIAIFTGFFLQLGAVSSYWADSYDL